MFKATLKAIAAATVITCGVLLPAAIAEAVEGAPLLRDAEPVESVTTGAAIRARADVQIRRIKTLMVSKHTDDDADYEQLEKLQKDLRGER